MINLHRLPLFGLLAQGAERTITVHPPIPSDFIPVAFTAHAGEVVITNHAPHSVTLKNHTLYPVAYALVFVRKEAVELTLIPWRGILDQVKAVGRKFVTALKG